MEVKEEVVDIGSDQSGWVQIGPEVLGHSAKGNLFLSPEMFLLGIHAVWTNEELHHLPILYTSFPLMIINVYSRLLMKLKDVCDLE